MDKKKFDNISRSFLENPTEVYESPEKLSVDDKTELFEIEEALAQMLYLKEAGQLPSNSAQAEADLAMFVDELGNTGMLAEDNTSRLVEIQSVLAAKRLMENENIPSVPVPETLMKVLRTPEKAGKAETSVPSIILRLTKESMEAVTSTLQGITQIPQVFEFTRSASAEVLEKNPRIELEQKLNGADYLNIGYQIVRESSTQLMLVVRYKEELDSQVRVTLSQDGRIVDSKFLSPETKTVSFSRLPAGFYELEMKGALENRISIQIDDEQ